MDETWKLSKGRSRSSTSRSSSSSKDYYSKQQQQYQQQEPHLVKSYSQRPSTSKRSQPLLTKSFSQRGSSSSSSSKQASWANNGSSSCHQGDSDLMRSGSQKGSSSSSSNNSIGKKCGSLAREQKARFYIMRRCVAMLVCWHENVDES